MTLPAGDPAAASLQGRVCVITGGTRGIGQATALALAARGATVVLLARSAGGVEAVRALAAVAGAPGSLHAVQADLARQQEVRRAADEVRARFGRVDVLVNNAAAYSFRRRTSPDGVELQLAVNHLAPFLLTRLLLDSLRASAPARVVTVSSEAHQRVRRIPWHDLQLERGYTGLGAYSLTKLYNLLFTRELARRLEGTGVTANAAHPGMVATALLLNAFPPLKLARRLLRTAGEGARAVVWLASARAAEGVTGRYFKDEREIAPSPLARDGDAALRLWQASEALVGLG